MRVSNALLKALTRGAITGEAHQTFISERSGSSVEGGLERAHLKEGRAVEGPYKVWPRVRQRGRREGVDSREVMAETDEQTWPWHRQVPHPGFTWYFKAWKKA